MPSWLRGTYCPGCYKMLYTLERPDGQTDWRHSGAPLEQDGIGPFVRCPNCTTRIRHRPSANVPGFGYEVIY